MINFFSYLISSPSLAHAHYAFVFLRVSIGILTMAHGLPKIMGGVPAWQGIGGVMSLFGIYFLPTMWGFIAASTEFFGGIALAIGLGTKISALFNLIMMVVALRMHLSKNDSFNVYSYAITMIVIFIFFFVMGSGPYSLDNYLHNR